MAFLADLRTAEAATQSGVTRSYTDRADRTWSKWVAFCHDLHHNPLLTTISDPIILLQVFAQRVRDGRASLSGNSVGAGTVSAYLAHVGQTLALLGGPDPRLNTHGQVDLRLARQCRAYSKEDPPPARALPIPLPILRHAHHLVHRDPLATPGLQATADLMALAYFFLMRPGEYCTSGETSHPFLLRDIQFHQGPTMLTPLASAPALLAASHVVLTFTDQKNSVRGEKVVQGRSGHPLFCPVTALARRVLHLRAHQAPCTTPIHAYWDPSGTMKHVSSQSVTSLLRRSAALLRDGTCPSHALTSRALRATGASALLLTGVDTNLIRLIGRWQSDAMLRYLHVQTSPLRHHLAQRMLTPNTAPPSPLPIATLPGL